MDRIKQLSWQFREGLLSDREYIGQLIMQLGRCYEEAKSDEVLLLADWLSGRLCLRQRSER